ncbi:conserved protein of unknown function [Tenacibaculum sp. 190130A14a]|uniref:DUF3822 family protein n=1 Tax=Tenacibaculum polynesiense TaxID=3137857 RepID=A0ABM9PCN8_9FLAO
MQKKTRKKSVIAQHKKLSIQFSLDGFSFCITNYDTEEIIVFTEYTFNKPISSPELLLTNLIEAFKTDEDLQHEFKQVEAVHQNNLSSLVPETYFDRNNLKPYLKYSVKTLATDFITYDDIEKIAAKNVYIPYVNINNFLFQNFGEFEYKHHSTVLIEKLLALSTTLEKQFYVHVGTTTMDIIVCNNEQLFLYNSFPYKTKEDFLYYILFTAEQLEMDPNEFQLYLFGDIERNSELFNITYNYVRNVAFIKRKTNFFDGSSEFSRNSNFILAS